MDAYLQLAEWLMAEDVEEFVAEDALVDFAMEPDSRETFKFEESCQEGSLGSALRDLLGECTCRLYIFNIPKP